MKSVMIAAAILTLSGSAVVAQSGSSTGGSAGSTMSPGVSDGGAGLRQAPIGHLQPRRNDTPPERTIDQIDPADAALDRKIKSICRGC